MNIDWHHLWHIVERFFDNFEILITMGIGAIAVGFRRWVKKVREDKALGWPSTDATIQSAEVRQQHEGYDVHLSYRYYVAQEYRYGKYVHHFRKKPEAEVFASTMRGRSLPVRYREDNPEISILIERDLELAGVLQAGARVHV